MAKPTLPPGFQDRFQAPGPSDGAKRILRHFKEHQIPQGTFEVSSELEALFSDPADCEQAQAELVRLGYIHLAPGSPEHIPVRSRVRGATLTLEGERYIAKNAL